MLQKPNSTDLATLLPPPIYPIHTILSERKGLKCIATHKKAIYIVKFILNFFSDRYER